MSPTNHSVPSSPSVEGYTPSFSTFPFNSAKSPLYLISPKTSSSKVEPTNFSCIGQSVTREGDCTDTGLQSTFFSQSDNNNVKGPLCCKDARELCKSCNHVTDNKNDTLGSSGLEARFEDVNLNTSEGDGAKNQGDEDQSEAQREEDLHYLGPGGYSLWRGEGGPGGWVRKMGYAERFMTGSADFGVMSTVYNLWFESSQLITFEMIKRTCYLVARKLPHLRLCVSRRDGELWFREMEELNLDIQEHFTSDILHSFETLLKKRFDLENGPLWFVRYVKIDDNDTTNTPVLNPNHKSRFVCIFGFHHNFSDGTTNMKFCNVFLNALNDVVLGRSTDMKVEAKLAEPFHDRLADKMRNEHFFRNNLWLLYYFCKRFYKGIISYGHYIRNYTDHFHQPAECEATTRLIPAELDEETTTKLLQRCREEKTSLNSTFTAAANVALYKMVLDKDSTVESTHFGGIQTVNMRRYWTKEQSEDSCGCHISTLDVQIPTLKKDLLDFWGYSRRVQTIMNDELNVSLRGIRLMPIGERLRLILYTNSFLEWAGYPSTNDNHYCVTNMGNLSKLFPGTGEVVEVTKLLRSVTCHYMPNLCQHTVHTFRGRLCYSLDYYTQKMEREHAKLYAKTLMDTLKEVVDAPRVSQL